MIKYCKYILQDGRGLEKQKFLLNRHIYNDFYVNVVLIGETANKISKSKKEDHPEIDWVYWIDKRNELVHEYEKLDLDDLWKVSKFLVPKLLPLLQNMIEEGRKD